MKQGKQEKKNILTEVFDTFFILIICFATLLSAMVMKGKVVSGMEYSIHPIAFAITIAGLLLYLFLIMTQSDKELKDMIKKLYDKQI